MNEQLTGFIESFCGSKQIDSLNHAKDSIQHQIDSLALKNLPTDALQAKLAQTDSLIRVIGNAHFESARNVLILGQVGIYSFFAVSFLALYVKSAKREIGLLLFFLYFLSAALYALVVFPDDANDDYKVLLSVINSFCLAFSFRYFNIVKEKKWKIFDLENWLVITIVACILTAVISKVLDDKTPDTILSIFIFATLSPILWFQFKARKSPLLGWLSLAVCAMLVFSFQYNYFEVTRAWVPRTTFNLISLVSTSALGTIFLALAFTWVFDEQTRSEEAPADKSGSNKETQTAGQAGVAPSIRQNALKIGINGEGEYIIELTFPEKDVENFEIRERIPVNLFKFLLTYAVSKVEGRPHDQKIYKSYDDFNNAIIQQLRKKLQARGFHQKEIRRDDLFVRKGKTWEIRIPKANIEIIGRDKIFEDDELTGILQ